MNDITAVFLCELAVESRRQDLLQLLHQELKKDFDMQHHALVAKMFAAASEPALQLQEQAEQLRNQVDQIDSLQALSDFQRETERLAGAWEALRGQTCEELHRVPPALENLHFLSGEELEKLRPALCKIINIHLYRLLTLGGIRAIQGLALPPVSQALSLLRYYWKEIVPAEQHVPPERWRMQWAVKFDPDAALGRMLRMPSYQLYSPDLSQQEILPGQYITWTLEGKTYYQGRGLLTNLGPEQMLQAMQQGIATCCTVQQLKKLDRLQKAPRQVLNQVFGQAFYAVEPYHFFSVVSYAMDVQQVSRRLENGRCLFCGTDKVKEGFHICEMCLSKLT